MQTLEEQSAIEARIVELEEDPNNDEFTGNPADRKAVNLWKREIQVCGLEAHVLPPK